MDGRHLSQLLERAAAEGPERIAVETETDRRLTYAELHRAADRVATRLSRWGVGPGDRVGLWLPKGLEVVAAIHGILKAGAAYVPVDPTGLLSGRRQSCPPAESRPRSSQPNAPRSFEPPGPTPSPAPPDHRRRHGQQRRFSNSSRFKPRNRRFILVGCHERRRPFTPSARLPGRRSGLHPVHFGVNRSAQRRDALSRERVLFSRWCRQSLGPWPAGERFASHAPLHFDLSIFDLFGACQEAGTLVLVGETLSKDPARLAQFITERRIDVWYSAPSILSLMACHGELDQPGSHAPRLVLFAGEVFPIAMLRRLRHSWPAATMWNLYGPTETNVCTAYPIPQSILDDQTEPFPIGQVCEPNKARVIDELGHDVVPGRLGELIVAGPSVMRGYFGQAELTDAAMIEDENGQRWYRTGDLVLDDGDGCFHFHGRRDRMVKKRGYRIELGEIESALYRHDGRRPRRVVARADDAGVSIAAFVSLKRNRKKSIIAMKRHCTLHLPNYMIPDTITFVDALPATSTDKVDYQRLRMMASD